MDSKTYIKVTSLIFSLIAIMHLLRIIFGWEAVFVGWVVPTWCSWVGVVVAGLLGYLGIRSLKK